MKTFAPKFGQNLLSSQTVVIVVSGRVSIYVTETSYDNNPCFSLSFVVRK